MTLVSNTQPLKPVVRAHTGIVVIGRNEGPRLRKCFESVLSERTVVIYVDSGSTDDSLDIARAMDVKLLELDMSQPFSAARARNAGVKELQSDSTHSLDFVHFVDGDCELIPHWLEKATAFLNSHPKVVAVCGRLKERFPDKSIYNQLCDIEWNRPPGEITACGGIFMMRLQPYLDVGGFRENLISGEEPELCNRLRQQGWGLWRLESQMAWHDAAMYQFSQWWIRSRRSGYGYAQTAITFNDGKDREIKLRVIRVIVWGGILPLLIAIASLLVSPLALFLLLIYPTQIVRVANKLSGPLKIRAIRSYFLMLGKFPEFLGALEFLYTHTIGSNAKSFDYKT